MWDWAVALVRYGMTTRVARLPSNRGDWQDPERVIKKKCLREIFFLCVCVGYITFMDWYQRSAMFHRAGVKAVLVLMPILGLTWLCGVLVPFSIIIAYIFILLNSLQVHFTHLSLSHDLSLSLDLPLVLSLPFSVDCRRSEILKLCEPFQSESSAWRTFGAWRIT